MSNAAPLLLLGVLAGAVHAQSTITVDTTADVVARNGACSFREAIIASNENRIADTLSENCAGSAVNDVINFRAGSNPVINVAAALPVITEQVTITGPSARVVIHGPDVSTDGIVIAATAPGTVVSRLVINNFNAGILVQAANVVIKGNFIGTDGTGATAAANQYGIRILANGAQIGGTSGVVPGGACTGDCNVIAAASGAGIRVESGTNVLIQGNMIGTNAAGTAALPTTSFGIVLLNNSTATIGGTTAAARNLISGSNVDGVYVFQGQDTAGSTILGNRIGTNAAGTAAIANGVGVHVQLNDRAYPLVVGGSAGGAGNVISGNATGVRIQGSQQAMVQLNRIGTTADGVSPLGNTGAGIEILDGSRQNVIGGDNETGNIIAFNAIGVRVLAVANNYNNTIVGNSIHDNTGKGIQLDDGQAGNAVTPTITGLNPATGIGCSSCRIDVYSDFADEGRVWQGATVSNGSWTMTAPVEGPYVTATATRSLGSTSEFSAPFFEDSDGDALADREDDCTLVANANQLDADHDGYGNVCDADLDNSSLVTVQDFNLFRTVLNQAAGSGALAAAADFDGSGLVTVQDFSLLRTRLNQAPGPSGLACAGTPPCPSN